MKFIIYWLAVFSFFHWLIGYGILGSIIASIVLVALSPVIAMVVMTSVAALWAGVLFTVGLVAVGITGLISKFKK